MVTFSRSLALRMSLAFLILSVPMVLLATYVSYREAERTLHALLEERLTNFASKTTDDMDRWLTRQQEAVQFFAGLPATAEVATTGDTARYASNIRRLPPSALTYTEVALLGVPGGRVRHSTDRTQIGTYAVTERYYEQGKRGLFTQTIYPALVTRQPAMTVAAPVRNAQGTVVGVLAAHLDLSELERTLSMPEDAVPIDAYLVNSRYELVSAARFGAEEHQRGVHSVGIDRAISNGGNTSIGISQYRDYRGEAVVGAYRWLPALEVALIVEAPQHAAFAPARRLLIVSALFGLLAMALLTMGVRAISQRIVAPLMGLTHAAEQVAGGDFAVEAPVVGTTELAALGTSFNAMTTRLRRLYGELDAQIAATREALREAQSSRALLQDVVDNTPTLVLVVGPDAAIRLANTRVTTFIGLPPERILGARLHELPGTVGISLADLVQDVRNGHASVQRELQFGESGDGHLWQAVAFPLTTADGASYAVGIVATDLTERARLEAERRAHDASVQQAQKLESLGMMAGGIAHDFNNLLGGILGNVELGRLSIDNQAEVREALDQIGVAARRAAELTRQMLAYAGRSSLRREVLDVRGVLHDIVPLVRAAQSKKIEFVVDAMPDPLWVELDPAQLSQVTLNLLTNAAEAIGSGEGRVTVRARYSATAPVVQEYSVPPEHNAGWVAITVEDNGPGVSDEVRQRMFEPFYSTKGAGRGLGLNAVRGIIRSNGGVLRLESVAGHGARFEVYFAAAAAPHQTVDPPSISDPSRRNATVLVVDDEEMLRRVTRRTLEAAGLRVLEAENGERGLATFLENATAISLVILDITMPGMDGLELLTELRNRRETLPAIIASGYDATDHPITTHPDEWTRFLQKPFSIQVLRDTALDLLARARRASRVGPTVA